MAITENHAIDFEFSYVDILHRRATHRVRLFNPGGWTTILVTDLTDKYACPSVTNSIEELINALLGERPEIRQERMVVIEHYDDRASRLPCAKRSATWQAAETFDLVSFSVDRRSRLCEPDWKRITKTQAEEWTGVRLP